jgi:acetate kinase
VGHDDWRSGERVAEAMPDHGAALGLVSRFLSDRLSRSYCDEVLGVGHRVVHGGTISQATLME